VKKFALALAIVATINGGVFARDHKAMMQDANNLAHEHLICAAFSSIVAACMIARDKDDPTGARYKEIGAAMTERGVRIGEVAGVSFEASKARLEMAYESMMTKIEKSCSNISILLQKHLDACVALHNEGPARLKAALEP
jgi:hypothetical protein